MDTHQTENDLTLLTCGFCDQPNLFLKAADDEPALCTNCGLDLTSGGLQSIRAAKPRPVIDPALLETSPAVETVSNEIAFDDDTEQQYSKAKFVAALTTAIILTAAFYVIPVIALVMLVTD